MWGGDFLEVLPSHYYYYFLKKKSGAIKKIPFNKMKYLKWCMCGVVQI